MKMFLLTNLRDPDPLRKGVPAVEFKYFKRYFALFFLKYLTFTLAPGIGITVADLNKKFSHIVFTNINLKINKMSTMDLFTNDEKDGFIATADRIGKYLDLYRSCKTRISRNYTLYNAKQVLPEDEYMLLSDMCIDWIEVLYQRIVDKDNKKDEPFIY